MLGLFEEFLEDFASAGLAGVAAQTTQILSENELVEILPDYDGWIIGDDPATYRVVEAASTGKLRAAVKWGVGIDNVDFPAFEHFGVPVENTPGVFGNEVADIALTYAIGLARETYWIDRQVRAEHSWPKPSGISMVGRTVALIGFGDIGQQIARRLIACGSRVVAYDPYFNNSVGLDVDSATWPDRLEEADFLIFACPLTDQTQGMFNSELLPLLKPGVRVVNVARGPVIVEEALINALESGQVHSAALDVFEVEPLPGRSPLRGFEKCIFGTHNSSNSKDAVRRVSRLAIEKMARLTGSLD
jgi:D-3-phosphoglycerate dehydrogenase